MRGVIEAPVVAYHDPFHEPITAEDRALELAYHVAQRHRNDAAQAEVAAFRTREELEEEQAHDEPCTGIGEEGF